MSVRLRHTYMKFCVIIAHNKERTTMERTEETLSEEKWKIREDNVHQMIESFDYKGDARTVAAVKIR